MVQRSPLAEERHELLDWHDGGMEPAGQCRDIFDAFAFTEKTGCGVTEVTEGAAARCDPRSRQWCHLRTSEEMRLSENHELKNLDAMLCNSVGPGEPPHSGPAAQGPELRCRTL